jgi:hypothetical protein
MPPADSELKGAEVSWFSGSFGGSLWGWGPQPGWGRIVGGGRPRPGTWLEGAGTRDCMRECTCPWLMTLPTVVRLQHYEPAGQQSARIPPQPWQASFFSAGLIKLPLRPCQAPAALWGPCRSG